LLDATKGGTPVALNANRFEERMPDWSADGKAIFFNSNRDGAVAVWRRSMTDGKVQKVGLESSFKSLASASGQALFFNAAGGALYRAGTDGSSPRGFSGS
jgi:Tol biopolymer transport system component